MKFRKRQVTVVNKIMLCIMIHVLIEMRGLVFRTMMTGSEIIIVGASNIVVLGSR